jgi:hypothetical protein
MELNDLSVNIIANAKDFVSGIDTASNSASSFSDKLSGIGKGVVTAGLGALTVGVGAATAGLIESVKAASDAEDIQAQLHSVLTSTGFAAGMSAGAINDLATELGNTTKFEDDAIVSGENLLLTFTGIGKDVFPDVTKTMLDMSQAMGQDLKSSALQLGKALNDPAKGLTALTRVGVTFTDEQKSQIQALVGTGKASDDLVNAGVKLTKNQLKMIDGYGEEVDAMTAAKMAGITLTDAQTKLFEGMTSGEGKVKAQQLLLAELKKEFGGSAEAAGQTASGQFEIFKNKLGNIGEEIGTSLLPTLTTLGGMLITTLNNPIVTDGITKIATGLSTFGAQLVANIPQIITTLSQIPTWFQNNQGIIVGILAALGVAVGAFVWTTVIPAITAVVVSMAPVILIIGAVGLAAYGLYQAWTTNFMGIQDTVNQIWTSISPIFNTIVLWLQTNIPVALKFLSTAWTTVLLPGIQAVWGWLSSTLFPFLGALGQLIGTIVVIAVRSLVAIFVNVLLPAVTDVWSFLQEKLGPTFTWLEDIIVNHLVKAFNWMSDAIRAARNWIRELIDQLNNLHIPSWLQIHSPPEIAQAFYWTSDSLKPLINSELPKLNAQLNVNRSNPISTKNDVKKSNDENLSDLLNQLIKTMDPKELGNAFANALINHGAI